MTQVFRGLILGSGGCGAVVWQVLVLGSVCPFLSANQNENQTYNSIRTTGPYAPVESLSNV